MGGGVYNLMQGFGLIKCTIATRSTLRSRGIFATCPATITTQNCTTHSATHSATNPDTSFNIGANETFFSTVSHYYLFLHYPKNRGLLYPIALEKVCQEIHECHLPPCQKFIINLSLVIFQNGVIF
jgi:hypothetical protein